MSDEQSMILVEEERSSMLADVKEKREVSTKADDLEAIASAWERLITHVQLVGELTTSSMM